VVLLDFSMPELDGPQTAIQIRQVCDDNFVVCPWLACVTAYTEPSFQKLALDAGMARFFTKPIGKESLDEIVRQNR